MMTLNGMPVYILASYNVAAWDPCEIILLCGFTVVGNSPKKVKTSLTFYLSHTFNPS